MTDTPHGPDDPAPILSPDGEHVWVAGAWVPWKEWEEEQTRLIEGQRLLPGAARSSHPGYRYSNPPNWPLPTPDWQPDAHFTPDPSWGPAPEDWEFWVPLEPEHAEASPPSALPPPPGGWSTAEQEPQVPPWRRLPAMAIAVIAAGVGVALIATLLVLKVGEGLTGGGGHKLTGTIDVVDTDNYFRGSDGSSDTSCAASGGYSDIAEGTQVIVKDGDGKTLAVGRLEQGERQTALYCTFAFTVEGIKDASFYKVEISHRGEQNYSRTDLEDQDWNIGLKLGP